jgi:hypothetical protein
MAQIDERLTRIEALLENLQPDAHDHRPTDTVETP